MEAMLKADIEHTLSGYAERFPADGQVIADLRNLQHQQAEITCRKEFRGHITCGAIVVSHDGRVLMIHHRALDRWLFPGGHLEPGDASLREAAQRELAEETGVDASTLAASDDEFAALPFQIDCHLIPERPAKAEPEHRHFDCRFIFRGEPGPLIRQHQEIKECAWVRPDRAPAEIRTRLRALGLI
jgi:8-oxo-dGTP pyrophosphatase MutT (NUDIX family)